jgi:hypothetical protein
MASLTDPLNTPAGTINASPVVPPTVTPPVTPPDMSQSLTGQPETAKIPETPTKAPVQPIVTAPITTEKPVVPATPSFTPGHTPVYDAQNNITGYNVTDATGKTTFQPSATPSTSTTTPSTTTPVSTADQLAQAQADYQTKAKQVSDTIDSIRSGVIPLNAGEQAQVDELKRQYDQLISEQKLANVGASGLANVRGYQTSAAEYDPSFQVKTIGAIITAGNNKVADLASKEASAIAALTTALKNNDIANIKDSWSIYQDASNKRTDALQKTIDDTQKAIKDARDAKIASDKVVYDQVTKPIQDMGASAAKNGAPADVVSKINASTDVASAMALAAPYSQDPTSTAGQYAAYIKSTQAKGLTPMTPGDFLAKQKAGEAYSTAYNAAAGKAAANNALGLNADGTPVAPTVSPTGVSGSILSATGLSVPAFNFLTQGTSALTRLSEGTRKQIMNEAQNFLNKNGVDIATFQSQYKALGMTVQANSLRNNQASVAEEELKATLDNLKTAADDSTFKSMRWANVAKLFAGQEFNDPNVSKYAFHLNQLREEFAMYNAALAGQIDSNGNIRQINESDRAVAENIIKDGFAKGGIAGFEEALASSRSKMQTVLESSINSQNKNVWKLFGVGDKYKAPMTTVDAKTSVDSYINENPSKAETVAKLYELPGWTDEKVMEYLNLNPK